MTSDTQVVRAAERPHYDPFVFYDDPYPIYARLRAEAPLYHNEERDLWVVTRFEDIQTVARDWHMYSSGEGVVLDDESDFYAPGGFVDQDPPSHDRLRAVMAPYFGPKVIRQLAEDVRTKTRDLIAPHLDTGNIDLAADIARPLPAAVICMLFDFPREDHPLLVSWFAKMLERIPGQVDAPASAWDANANMRDYFVEAARERERRLGDDLLSILVRAQADGVISSEELVGLGIFMFYSGIITTAGLISNSFFNLLHFPDQRALLARDSSLVQDAVEELVRYDAPIQSLSRVAAADAQLRDATIPQGSRVLLVYASANRDESRWPDGDRIDINRERKRHLAFGEGIHYCIGAPLARLEATVAFEEVLAVMPDYELSGPVKRLYTPHERGLESIPVAFDQPANAK